MRDKGKPWPPRHRNVLKETMQSLEELIQDVDDDIPWLEVPATPPTVADQGNETEAEPLRDIADADLDNTLFDDNGPIPATERRQQPPSAAETQAAADGGMFDWDDSGGSFAPAVQAEAVPKVSEDTGSRAAPGETIDWVDADESSQQQAEPVPLEDDEEEDIPILENVSAARTDNTPAPEPPTADDKAPMEMEDDEPILEHVSVVRTASSRIQQTSAPLGRVLVETQEIPAPDFPPDELLKQVVDFINVRLDLLTNNMLDKDTVFELRESLRDLLAAWNQGNKEK